MSKTEEVQRSIFLFKYRNEYFISGVLYIFAYRVHSIHLCKFKFL